MTRLLLLQTAGWSLIHFLWQGAAIDGPSLNRRREMMAGRNRSSEWW